ncbi:MAG: bifunctional (p)ppGpp synthetase/guanosine-3',5'-bis(diphosphate) 3'-pyrophosphohydrolase [candidate division NC10 bacterium]|nr:bifunctional (p)ppGpp synthetase/guanosine-3',5'-bis(diphosphate) 3'-pyrophosphohydrolase [candidate division NC10 bacterium]
MQIQEIVEKVQGYHPTGDVEVLRRAYTFAERLHHGQARVSGDPYLSHPLAVAGILADLKLDSSTIAAGLLHDVVEDTKTTLHQVEREFGQDIAELVDGVTKLGKLPISSREERQAENFRKMLLAMSKDIRVLLIKLADRLHNMRTLEPLPEEKRKRIAQETLDIHAPLAHRLGIYWVKAELEDLALHHLDAEAYRDLTVKVAKKRKEREGEINEVIEILMRKLHEVGIPAEITGRPKHFYSIYKKMRDQGKDFDEIYDLTAIRVITGSVKDCYGSLGVVHSLWKPLPGRFKDFIAVPKTNFYQSLHTTVVGPRGEPVEIQIRTWEMHKVAEEGIAAHWLYKEGKSTVDQGEKGFAWLRQLMEWQRDLKDSREFWETVKVDLFPDEVYMFTPKGDVKALPKGSTPIDFAFAIHTDIGLHCLGSKVNGRLLPLRYELQNGDIVEILTDAKQHPSRDWLKIVKTSRARSKIKQWLKAEERARSISLGRDLLEREVRRLGKSPSALLSPEALAPLLQRSGFAHPEEFFAAVGYGRFSPRQAMLKLLPPEELKLLEREEREAKGERKTKPRISEEGVKIRGVNDVLVRFAKCCNPLPGDEIVGFITRGRGVSIHTRDCPNADQLLVDPDRKIVVEWDSDRQVSHQVRILVTVGKDRPGLLAEISSAISASNINIAQAEVKVTEDRKGLNTFMLEVSDLKQLQAAMHAIQRIDGVLKVERVKSL